MIFRLLSLTLLVTQLVLAYDHKIDLRRCKNETACFIRESCFMDKSDPEELEFPKWQKTLVQYMGDGLVGGNCDVVLQMKQLNNFKLHIMMQIKLSNTDKINIEDGIKLVQSRELFVCKPDNIIGDQAYKLNFLGKQTFEDQFVFCSFTADVLHENGPYFYHFNKYPGTTILIFTKNSNQYVKMERFRNVETIWTRLERTHTNTKTHNCDQTVMSSSTKLNPQDSSLLLKEVDITLSNPRCNTYFLIPNIDATDFLRTSKVICDDKYWKYADEGTLKNIYAFTKNTSRKFELFCVDKVCRQCKSVPPSQECDGCESARLSLAPSDDHYTCNTLSCPNDRWTLSGDLIVTGKAECKPSTADPSKFAWFLKETQLEKATCVGMNSSIPVEAK